MLVLLNMWLLSRRLLTLHNRLFGDFPLSDKSTLTDAPEHVFDIFVLYQVDDVVCKIRHTIGTNRFVIMSSEGDAAVLHFTHGEESNTGSRQDEWFSIWHGEYNNLVDSCILRRDVLGTD